MGLVNAVVEPEELDAEVDRWCEQILRRSPQGLRLAKIALNAATDALYSSTNHGMELMALNHVYGPEPQEGIASFQEKRPGRLAQVPRGAGARSRRRAPDGRVERLVRPRGPHPLGAAGDPARRRPRSTPTASTCATATSRGCRTARSTPAPTGSPTA